jgi:hypothetical protein
MDALLREQKCSNENVGQRRKKTKKEKVGYLIILSELFPEILVYTEKAVWRYGSPRVISLFVLSQIIKMKCVLLLLLICKVLIFDPFLLSSFRWHSHQGERREKKR